MLKRSTLRPKTEQEKLEVSPAKKSKIAKKQPEGDRGEIPLCTNYHGLFCCTIEVPFFLAGHKTSISIDKQVITFKKDRNFIYQHTTLLRKCTSTKQSSIAKKVGCQVHFIGTTFLYWKIDMELGNGWLFSIGNRAVIRPLEKGNKSPAKIL